METKHSKAAAMANRLRNVAGQQQQRKLGPEYVDLLQQAADELTSACDVNDKLVAALDLALGVMEENCRGTGGKDYSGGAIDAARAALAAAGAA